MATKKKNTDKLDTVLKLARTILEHTAQLTEDMTTVKTDVAVVKAITTSNSDHLVSIEGQLKGRSKVPPP